MKHPIDAWPRLLDTELAAAYLSVSKRTIESWIGEGLLQPVSMPGTTIRRGGQIVARGASRRLVKSLIDKEDLDRFIEMRKEL